MSRNEGIVARLVQRIAAPVVEKKRTALIAAINKAGLENRKNGFKAINKELIHLADDFHDIVRQMHALMVEHKKHSGSIDVRLSANDSGQFSLDEIKETGGFKEFTAAAERYTCTAELAHKKVHEENPAGQSGSEVLRTFITVSSIN